MCCCLSSTQERQAFQASISPQAMHTELLARHRSIKQSRSARHSAPENVELVTCKGHGVRRCYCVIKAS